MGVTANPAQPSPESNNCQHIVLSTSELIELCSTILSSTTSSYRYDGDVAILNEQGDWVDIWSNLHFICVVLDATTEVEMSEESRNIRQNICDTVRTELSRLSRIRLG